MAVSPAGAVFVAGMTRDGTVDAENPFTQGGSDDWDGIVRRIDPDDGSIMWTRAVNTDQYGFARFEGIAADDNYVYVTGNGNSTGGDFSPASFGAIDGVVARMHASNGSVTHAFSVGSAVSERYYRCTLSDGKLFAAARQAAGDFGGLPALTTASTTGAVHVLTPTQ